MHGQEETKNTSLYPRVSVYNKSKKIRAFDIRFEAGRHHYNACLSEALKRLAAMNRSKKWRFAVEEKKNKLRSFSVSLR